MRPVPRVGAHSIGLLFVHLVWATRSRQCVIVHSLDEPLRRFLMAKARELDATLLAFGAAADHVHLLAQIPPELSAAALAGRLKGASSHEFRRPLAVGWQVGYSVESVDTNSLETTLHYVNGQRERHRTRDAIEAWELQAN